MTQKPEIVRQRAAKRPAGRPPAAADPAAPRDAFHLLPGFQVERLFTVPKEKCGSWVSLTVDPKGRIIASDEAKCRPLSHHAAADRQQRTDPRRAARRQSFRGAGSALRLRFVVRDATAERGALPAPRYQRRRPVRRSDQAQRSGRAGDHGPPALRLSPDGQANLTHCRRPFGRADRNRGRSAAADGGVRAAHRHVTLEAGSKSRPSPNWDEDLLLPCQWDSGGWAVGILAPNGWIAATDPNGKEWEILTIGLRNAYDIALNADGEVFTYDSDMEPDMGMPWYQPTRILHAAVGADFGSRSGTGRWPSYRVDTLPAAVNIGPGSPVGMEFGYGTKFPAEYQRPCSRSTGATARFMPSISPPKERVIPARRKNSSRAARCH